MMLGALIDAGADAEKVRSGLDQLGVKDWTLRVEPIERNGIGATNLSVDTNEGHTHRTAGDIAAIVDSSSLPEQVRDNAKAVFSALAQAEGAVHDMDPDKVHFHEVGGIDAIVDVVGTCIALDLLGIERIVVSPVAVGHGITKSAHGRIPHPAPATSRLLDGIPIKGLDTTIELTTPTGAAIVRALANDFGPAPAMTVSASGFGAGDAELPDHPNLLQVLVGDDVDADLDITQLLVLEANIDDLTGEYLAHGVEQLMAEGCLDAWITPIEMKGGRPGVTLSALIEPVEVGRIGSVLLAETGSLGFRTHGVDRMAAPRQIGHVEVAGHRIAIKSSHRTVKAEFRDVAAAAAALDRPAREVAAEAEDRWRHSVASND